MVQKVSSGQTLKIVNQIFCMKHRLMIIHNQIRCVWGGEMVERFMRYHADTIGHTDRMTDRQTDGVMPI